MPVPLVMQRNFQQGRNLATGFAASGSGIGVFMYAPLCRYLLDTYGWRGTYLIMGGILLHGVPLACALKPNPIVMQTTNLKDSEYNKQSESTDKTCDDEVTQKYDKELESIEAPTLQFVDDHGDFHTSSLQCNKHDTANISYHKHLNILLNNGSDDHLPSNNQDVILISKFGNHDHQCETINNSYKKKELTTEQNLLNSTLKESQNTYQITKSLSKNICSSHKCIGLPSNSLHICSRGLHYPRSGKLRRSTISYLRILFDCSVMKETSVQFVIVAIFIKGLVSSVPWVWLPIKAYHCGIDSMRTSFLISAVGVADAIGRNTFGALGMHISSVYLLTSGFALSGILNFIVTFMSSYEFIMAYSIAFGLLYGKYICLLHLTFKLRSKRIKINKNNVKLMCFNHFGYMVSCKKSLS